MLCFCGALSGTMDHDLSILYGIGDRRLRFQVELRLPKVMKYSRKPVRRGLHGRVWITAPYLSRWTDKAAQFDGTLDRQDWFTRRDLDFDESFRSLQDRARFRGHHHDRLPDVENFAVGKHRLVLKNRPESVLARQIIRRKNANNAWQCASGGCGNRSDPPTGRRTADKADLQFVGARRDIVDERRRPGHMTDRRIVRKWFTDAGHCYAIANCCS